MSLKVIGAGFGRTGTESMKKALEILGFDPCYHMHEVKPPQHEFWIKALDGEAINWDDIYSEYSAAVDWPTSAFVEPLRQRYPDAKIILTVRSASDWFESFSSTIVPVVKIGLQSENADRRRKIGMTHKMLNKVFDGDYESRENVINKFNQHNKNIINSIPESDLLVFELGDGWEPLCKFLNIAVPECDFPNRNSRAEFKKNAGLKVNQPQQMDAEKLRPSVVR